MSASDIITTMVAAAGGSAVVVGGLARSLGKLWADRIVEAQKASNAREIESIKSMLELARARELRISDAKFELYSGIWNALQDVKTLGDRLWERADRENVNIYRQVLETAIQHVNRGSLILGERWYKTLCELLRVFASYEFGKRRLVEIRSDQDLEKSVEEYGGSANAEESIHNQIRNNKDAKEAYERLLNELVLEFREQLGIRV